MGNTTIARMAREDSRLYVAGAVFFAVVAFLALPIAVMIVIDNQKRISKIEAKVDDKLQKLDRAADDKPKKEFSTARSKDERDSSTMDQPSKAD